jgi:peptidyl-prolyl cis-trans isomerase SurA
MHASTLLRTALASALLLGACGEQSGPSTGPRSSEGAPATGRGDTPAPPAAPPQDSPAATTEPEACAQVIVVAWQGAQAAADTITRSEEEARARAESIRERLDAGESFGLVARAESDAASSGPRGGLLGTYARSEWPAAHLAVRDVVFGLEVDQTSDVVHAPYGYVVARRCRVEKVSTRHILVRYRGARNAGEEIVRGPDEARALAEQLRARATAPGADFGAIAREASEDASAERSGELGPLGRGRLAPAFEQAAFALQPGQVSEVVETEYGFHVIQRMPDPPSVAPADRAPASR